MALPAPASITSWDLAAHLYGIGRGIQDRARHNVGPKREGLAEAAAIVLRFAAEAEEAAAAEDLAAYEARSAAAQRAATRPMETV